MRSHRVLAASVTLVLLSACGSDGQSTVGGSTASVPSTLAVTPTTPATGSTVDPLSSDAPSASATTPAPPFTAGDDLFDPESWVGHLFTESMMAAPYPEVSLDEVATGWVSAMEGCGMMDGSVRTACIAFVRPDPGADGQLSDPSTWMVLSWKVDPTNYTLGGPVLDAVAVLIDDPELMPVGLCRSVSGEPGLYEAFVRYDPTYLPAPGATAVTPEDIAAHPVVFAWTLDADHQIVELPADTVECVLYSYGD